MGNEGMGNEGMGNGRVWLFAFFVPIDMRRADVRDGSFAVSARRLRK